MTDDAPWTSMVIADGETTVHGRDPENHGWTLCGAVSVDGSTLYRGPFYGTAEGDRQICAELVRDSHY